MIELLNCDCMTYMAGLKDKAFDLAIVDPPYGIEKQISVGGGAHTKAKVKFHHLYNAGTKWDKRPDKMYFRELRRVCVNIIVCGGNYFADNLPVSRGWAIYDKVQDGLTVVANELIYTSFDLSVKTFRRLRSLDNGFMNAEGKNIHPTQKPKELYRWLLHNYAQPGQRILDTHLGSGSSAIAAHQMGFEFVGCEIDKDYYDAACKRFKEQTMQQSLFQ